MKEERCGNDGRGTAVENSRLALRAIQARHRVSHRRPPPLEIANDAISTFPQRRPRFYLSKSQKQKQNSRPSARPDRPEFTKGETPQHGP
jgi:hypothetical protein